MFVPPHPTPYLTLSPYTQMETSSIHTRSACGGMSVQKSVIIGLNVESVPRVLTPKPNLSEGEAPHEDATHEE
ncbi:protogenin [Lates japonicus]